MRFSWHPTVQRQPTAMNFVSTGVKEVTRRVRRQQNRRALVGARRSAERAETELGRRGWQALVEDLSIRPHFEALQKLNEEVARANARISELETKLRDQEKEREAARTEHKATLQQIEQERQPVQQSLHTLQTRFAEQQKALHEQNAKKSAFEAERHTLDKTDERLKSARFPEARRDERLQQSAQRRAVLSEQLATLDFARTGFAESSAATNEELKAVRPALLTFDKRAQAARSNAAARERAATMAIADLTKQIALIRRQAKRIEAQKDEPFQHIGHRLVELGAAPAGAESQFADAKRRRQSHERLIALDSAWTRESHEANKQDLRVFTFVVVTVALLVAGLTALIFFRAPIQRDWLPSNTEAILALNVSRFTDAEFARALQSKEPGAWQEVWTGLVRKVAEMPEIDVRNQVSRITRALAPSADGGPPVDYLLVEMRSFVAMDALLDRLTKKDGFYPWMAKGGLRVYEKADLALAQIGPSTLALGSRGSVEELIQVRLGLKDDLKTDAQFFSAFQKLDDESAFRLVTQHPNALTYLASPLLGAQLLADCHALGMTLDLRDPVTAVFLINATNAPAAERIVKQLQSAPDEALQLRGFGPSLFAEPPTVQTHDRQVEWRFKMTGSPAREFLQRIARMGLAGTSESVARADESSGK